MRKEKLESTLEVMNLCAQKSKTSIELEVAKIKQTEIPNPIFEEVKRVETFRNQVMGIKENILEKKEFENKIDDSILLKSLNLTHEKLIQSRNKKIDIKKELLK